MQRIAIIGGGIAGLTAAYLLHKRYYITLYEKSNRVGGNAYTYTTSDGIDADVGVMSFERKAYRNFFRLMEHLGIDSVSGAGQMGGGFVNLQTDEASYISPHLRGLIAQRFGFFNPSRLINNLLLPLGMQDAKKLVRSGAFQGLTLEQALQRLPRIKKEGKLAFISTLCMMSSMHCDELLASPAEFFFGKLNRYGTLFPPQILWRIRFMRQGTRSYIEKLSSPIQDGIKLNARIQSVVRNDQGVVLVMHDGERHHYDRVIFACHADQALSLLDRPSEREQNLLGVWRYTKSEIVVHRDLSPYPQKDLLDGYTFLYTKGGRYINTSVTFSLWILPTAPMHSDWMITQHQNFPIRQDRIDATFALKTPIFDFAAVAAQAELPRLNGELHSYYCGSHFGFGLHEDAVTSAIRVAEQLGVEF
ncbi:MAG: FAD-dependent oxidoreductase [Pseudomonadota bacterium]